MIETFGGLQQLPKGLPQSPRQPAPSKNEWCSDGQVNSVGSQCSCLIGVYKHVSLHPAPRTSNEQEIKADHLPKEKQMEDRSLTESSPPAVGTSRGDFASNCRWCFFSSSVLGLEPFITRPHHGAQRSQVQMCSWVIKDDEQRGHWCFIASGYMSV